jgi:DNA-binding MarR family transcriptional regulator
MSVKVNKENAYTLVREQIRKIERSAQHYSRELQQKHGITGPQLGVLRLIAKNPHTTLTDLSATLQLHITTVESFIERLHKRKLINKRRGRNDKRSVEISISAAGQNILKVAPLGGFMKLNDNLEKLPDRELQKIYDALGKLVELYGASDIKL